MTQTMDTATKITPAARRIARETNSTPRGIATRFDIEGQVLDRHPADMWYLPGNGPTGIAITTHGLAGWGHMTYRHAQDCIDAYNAHPDDPDDREFYLQQLQTQRSFERFGEYR